MHKVRICPACGHENTPECLICSWCLEDISETEPAGDTKRSEPRLAFSFSGLRLEIRHGDVIGRSAVGRDVLKGQAGVSRKHLLVVFVDDAWFVEDLGSTNGTSVNGRQIGIGIKYQIRTGDTIALSRHVTLVVL
ncbi:MAG TPA: FHA domain-containing protein [Candidatus Ozemobacteraceae bacterium]|nr:FHA domain-containing protein [Candidatus Ozemobacteraceae bacterium]